MSNLQKDRALYKSHKIHLRLKKINYMNFMTNLLLAIIFDVVFYS